MPGKALDCAIPVSIAHQPLAYELPVSELQPGEVKIHKFHQDIKEQQTNLAYDLRAFEVYPAKGPRYYQVQLELISPARATCMLSVDASKTLWSPMNCVAVDGNSTRWGLLLQASAKPADGSQI